MAASLLRRHITETEMGNHSSHLRAGCDSPHKPHTDSVAQQQRPTDFRSSVLMALAFFPEHPFHIGQCTPSVVADYVTGKRKLRKNMQRKCIRRKANASILSCICPVGSALWFDAERKVIYAFQSVRWHLSDVGCVFVCLCISGRCPLHGTADN